MPQVSSTVSVYPTYVSQVLSTGSPCPRYQVLGLCVPGIKHHDCEACPAHSAFSSPGIAYPHMTTTSGICHLWLPFSTWQLRVCYLWCPCSAVNHTVRKSCFPNLLPGAQLLREYLTLVTLIPYDDLCHLRPGFPRTRVDIFYLQLLHILLAFRLTHSLPLKDLMSRDWRFAATVEL